MTPAADGVAGRSDAGFKVPALMGLLLALRVLAHEAERVVDQSSADAVDGEGSASHALTQQPHTRRPPSDQDVFKRGPRRDRAARHPLGQMVVCRHPRQAGKPLSRGAVVAVRRVLVDRVIQRLGPGVDRVESGLQVVASSGQAAGARWSAADRVDAADKDLQCGRTADRYLHVGSVERMVSTPTTEHTMDRQAGTFAVRRMGSLCPLMLRMAVTCKWESPSAMRCRRPTRC